MNDSPLKKPLAPSTPIDREDSPISNEEKAVAAKIFESRGLKGRDVLVEAIKSDAAVLMARLGRIEVGGEATRLIALAKTNLETAVMFAVKAVSRSPE